MALLSKVRPRGFGGAGELMSGSWGTLVIILGELGSKHILLEIKGALPKTEEKQFQGFGEIGALFLGIKGAQIPLPTRHSLRKKIKCSASLVFSLLKNVYISFPKIIWLCLHLLVYKHRNQNI